MKSRCEEITATANPNLVKQAKDKDDELKRERSLSLRQSHSRVIKNQSCMVFELCSLPRG
jgi:hypothetical protein